MIVEKDVMIYNRHMGERVAATAADQSPAGREGPAGGVFTKQTQFGKTKPISPARPTAPNTLHSRAERRYDLKWLFQHDIAAVPHRPTRRPERQPPWPVSGQRGADDWQREASVRNWSRKHVR